jgi:hypothetical protein
MNEQDEMRLRAWYRSLLLYYDRAKEWYDEALAWHQHRHYSKPPPADMPEVLTLPNEPGPLAEPNPHAFRGGPYAPGAHLVTAGAAGPGDPGTTEGPSQ